VAATAQNQASTDGNTIFYYENGVKSSEGLMRKGKPDGYWFTYYETGLLKSEGNRKNFMLDSTWKFYDETGKLSLIINYKEGKKHGERITYRDDEIISENFENDVKQGLTTHYYLDSTIFKTTNFVNGLEEGLAKEFGEDGRVTLLVVYKKGYIVSRERINRLDNEGRKQGNWKFFHENGMVKTEGRYLNDLKDGYFKDYDDKGRLLATSKWQNGEKVDSPTELIKLEVVKEYYPDGTVKVLQTFKNGIEQGVRREYNEDGSVKACSLFDKGIKVAEGIVKENGKNDGPWKELYPNGQLKAEGTYTNGVKTGEWKYYHPNGNIEQTGKYTSEGKLTGKWTWYYPSGNILREENYLKGLADGLMTEFTEEGSIVAEGEFIEGMEDGPWIFQNGEHREEGNFSYGLRNGIWKYYDGESLKFEGEFVDDNPNGKHIFYWDNGKVKDEINYRMGIKDGDWKKYDSEGLLYLVISYENGVEKKYDGIIIKPAFTENPDEQ
jgi:antitoxin component YwqK of YwqJK toxin-antitoxin module